MVTVVTIQADMEPPTFVACEHLIVAAPLLVVVAADLFVELTHAVDLLQLRYFFRRCCIAGG